MAGSGWPRAQAGRPLWRREPAAGQRWNTGWSAAPREKRLAQSVARRGGLSRARSTASAPGGLPDWTARERKGPSRERAPSRGGGTDQPASRPAGGAPQSCLLSPAVAAACCALSRRRAREGGQARTHPPALSPAVALTWRRPPQPRRPGVPQRGRSCHSHRAPSGWPASARRGAGPKEPPRPEWRRREPMGKPTGEARAGLGRTKEGGGRRRGVGAARPRPPRPQGGGGGGGGSGSDAGRARPGGVAAAPAPAAGKAARPARGRALGDEAGPALSAAAGSGGDSGFHPWANPRGSLGAATPKPGLAGVAGSRKSQLALLPSVPWRPSPSSVGVGKKQRGRGHAGRPP